MGEDQVLELLNFERKGPKRIVVLERLHQRYSTLRVARERAVAARQRLALGQRGARRCRRHS